MVLVLEASIDKNPNNCFQYSGLLNSWRIYSMASFEGPSMYGNCPSSSIFCLYTLNVFGQHNQPVYDLSKYKLNYIWINSMNIKYILNELLYISIKKCIFEIYIELKYTYKEYINI